MRQFITAVGLAAALTACGGGGGDAQPAAASSSPPLSAGIAYPQSVVLGRFDSESLGFIDGQPGQGLALDAPAASALISAGRNPLAAIYREAATPEAIVACVSAPTSGTGIVDNINLGVNIRSVAALLGAGWRVAPDARAAWGSLAGAQFDNWENCGEKPEGRPSLASHLVITPDGGYSEDVYDGNFGTNLNTISLRYGATQVAAMLSSEGWLNPGTGNGARRVWLRIYRHTSGATLLLLQGWPEDRGPAAGFLGVYFRR
jgi:hypothetical protein